ncbi:hypothetical protein PENTCL1PPCAC_28504, partial [Pristionchus entomophagus]
LLLMGASSLLVFSFFLLLHSISSSRQITSTLHITEDAVFDKNYTGKTRPNGELSVFHYSVTKDDVVRIRMTSRNANLSTPLLSVFREPATIISIQLPIMIKNYMYNSTARTLCPYSLQTVNYDGNLTISVELSSHRPIDYQFSATILQNFHLNVTTPMVASASAAEPVFYQFDFPPHLDSVVIWIKSNSSICMTVSIQKAECPVFDLENNVISGGLHQTMTKSGSITVERRYFEKFFVIFVIRPNDDECSTMEEIIPPHPHYMQPREKTFMVDIQSAPNMEDYILPIAFTFGGIIIIYSLAIVFVLTMGGYEKQMMVREGRQLLAGVEEAQESAPSTSQPYMTDRFDYSILENEASTSSSTSRSSPPYRDLEETASLRSYDTVPDARDKFVVRQNVNLTVGDLSLKPWKQRDKKYNRYVVSLITISLFYGLPVVQLVLTWQDTVRSSGNLDLCWYNFRCARPFSVFFAFNNVISNAGYITLGLLFLLMVKEREMRYRSLCKIFPNVLQKDYGLPHHNGLMYAIGVAVVMEGVLSASYHICPSSSNYQFDTSFMYIIGLLGMLKIYQLRHPDINANAHVSFAVAAFFIFLAMMGVYLNTIPFWIFFSLSYFIIMFMVSVEFYFKGLWRLNFMEILRSIQYTFVSSKWCSCLVPAYPGRFLFLIIGNSINLGMVVIGLIKRPKDFPSFMLGPFIANLFLYLLYYIVMKFVHRERLRARAIAFLVLAFICWMAGGWFFLNNVSDWSETPAVSRELNHDCILLAFYDNHDVWHFLSSVAIFMSFSLINCVDDDLQWVRRDKIAVF